MTLQLRNCEFAFQCNAQWDKLAKTDQDSVRFCNECEKEVHRCETDEELLRAIRSNLCVAIPSPYPSDKPARRMLLGSMRARPASENKASSSVLKYTVTMQQGEWHSWLKSTSSELIKNTVAVGSKK